MRETVGIADGRRLNANRKPTHCIYLHGKPTGLYPLPLDTIYATRSVNAQIKMKKKLDTFAAAQTEHRSKVQSIGLPKTLGAAREEILHLREEAGIEATIMPKTLDKARAEITTLRNKLSSKAPTPAPSRTPSVPARLSSVIEPANAPELAISPVSAPAPSRGLQSFESIQSQIDKTPNAQSKYDILSSHAAAYREQAKSHPNLSADQLALFKQASQLERNAAYTLYSDPVAWKNRDRAAKVERLK